MYLYLYKDGELIEVIFLNKPDMYDIKELSEELKDKNGDIDILMSLDFYENPLEEVNVCRR